jgi:DNA-binding PadR family transcriptional regulator
MPRWYISGPDRVHSSEPRVPTDQPQRESSTASPAIGRGGNNDSSTDAVERKERPTETTTPRAAARRTQHQDRDRTYSLRSSEMEAIIDIGRFRTLDVQDLSRFAYRGDAACMRQDLEGLRKQGLVEEKTVFRAHKSARKVVTLTEQGHRIVTKLGGLREGQRVYHGFVKPKEVDHDADLYKVYQKAVQEIQEKGGKPLRVRLDFELKERVNRAKEAARGLSEKEPAILLRAVAEENGLAITGATIHLPDIQVEYETRDGKIERENLELLSQNYREDGIRDKVAAGFKIYARNGEANRIRRALHDTGLVREVLSV